MMRLVLFFLACSVGLSACALVPELDAAGPVNATPPDLVPLDDILTQAASPGTDPGPLLAARAAALKARAAAISATP